MKNVCVITGGGSGMGLATARILGKENYIIICGRTVEKLESAVDELKAAGIESEAFPGDIRNAESTERLAARAKAIGKVTSLINAAGLSPHMADAATIMETNALGTINVDESFYEVMEEGSCVINIASMAAYFIPKFIIPTKDYGLSGTSKELFMKKMMTRVNMMPKRQRAGLSYSVSKNFVVWYTKANTVKFGQKGIRMLSVSPGSFNTPMGDAERVDAEPMTKYAAVKRMGNVKEIAQLLAYLTDEKLGYLTGTDIICDGGLVASGYNPAKKQQKLM